MHSCLALLCVGCGMCHVAGEEGGEGIDGAIERQVLQLQRHQPLQQLPPTSLCGGRLLLPPLLRCSGGGGGGCIVVRTLLATATRGLLLLFFAVVGLMLQWEEAVCPLLQLLDTCLRLHHHLGREAGQAGSVHTEATVTGA